MIEYKIISREKEETTADFEKRVTEQTNEFLKEVNSEEWLWSNSVFTREANKYAPAMEMFVLSKEKKEKKRSTGFNQQ